MGDLELCIKLGATPLPPPKFPVCLLISIPRRFSELKDLHVDVNGRNILRIDTPSFSFAELLCRLYNNGVILVHRSREYGAPKIMFSCSLDILVSFVST